MRARLLASLLVLPVLLAGCTGDDGAAFGATTLAGVGPSSAGDVNLTAGAGVLVTPSAENHTVEVGLAPVAQTRVLHACEGGCRNLSVLPGTVIAESLLISLRNLSLNAAGPDRDAAIFFYDNGQETGQWLRWADARSRFVLSSDLHVGGNLTASTFVGTTTPLVLGAGTPQQQVFVVETAALEGGEVTVFARGSAQLVNGTANIALPLDFQALALDENVTAQVTLTSRGPALFVSEKGVERLVVESADGSGSDATFDWFVQAPRKGAETFRAG